MSAAAGRTAGKVGQAVAGATAKANNAANEAAAGKGRQSVLNKGAKRDPELYVRLDIPRSSLRAISTNLDTRSFSPS